MEGFSYIKDLTYEYRADLGLAYSSPCRGTWNIVHYGLLVPEAHLIFVCPVSCLRGVVLTTAEMGPDAMKLLSTIAVGEDNILNGDMEEELQKGVERVIESLPKRPRMVMIYTSCIHHFLAVNYQRVYKVLHEKYPDIEFTDCYMDPIMRRKTPPMANIKRQVLRPLKDVEKNPFQANIIGNCFPMGEHCDLVLYMRENGIPFYDLTTMQSFDEYHNMASSSVNFSFHGNVKWAAKDLEVRLHQKHVFMRESYDYDTIDEDMKKAAESFGTEAISAERIAEERKKTEEAVADLKAYIGDTPLSIDDTAVDRPLELALYLTRRGFDVESVIMEVNGESEEVFNALKAEKPDLKVYSAENYTMRRARFKHEGKIIGIGAKSAYVNDSPYFVNINENDGMYGYAGIRHLCDLIKEASEEEKDTKKLVQIKGLNCDIKRGCTL